MTERLLHPTFGDIEALTGLWEASVRATHHFLQEEDIAFYRPLVEEGIASAGELYVKRNTSGFTAFMGIEGDKIEMLFVDPAHRGRGLGGQLIGFALRERGARQVDVNEQNTQAVGFYRHLGFRITGRDAKDPSGRPYPILQMEIAPAEPRGLVPIPNLMKNPVDVDFSPEQTDGEK